jgi:hypothetical protein
MADPFGSVWRKIERAKRHTVNLEARNKAFFRTKPYEVESQIDPKTGRTSYRIKGTPKPLPETIPLILDDAAHNLRVALDHFACGAVSTVTGTTAFPVWRASALPTVAQWHGEVNRKLAGASPRLIQAVKALDAYEAGNGQYLWAVNELDRIDKHRLLLSVAGAHTAVVIDFGEGLRRALANQQIPNLPLALRRPEWTPVEEGTELFIAPDGLDTEPEFTFQVTLGEPAVLKGEPVVPALRRLINEVENLLKRLVPLA